MFLRVDYKNKLCDIKPPRALWLARIAKLRSISVYASMRSTCHATDPVHRLRPENLDLSGFATGGASVNHHRGGRGGLDDGGDAGAQKHPLEGAAGELVEDQLQFVARHLLQPVPHEGHAEEEEGRGLQDTSMFQCPGQVGE